MSKDAFDALLAERLQAALRDSAPMDWREVVRRSRADTPAVAHRRRVGYVLITFAVLVVCAAPAFAFRGAIVEFFASPPATPSVVRNFGALEILAVPHHAPGVFPTRARRVDSIPFDGHTATLYVAPTREGGFCDLWSLGAPECLAGRAQAQIPGVLGGFSYGATNFDLGIDRLQGSVLSRNVTVSVRYADNKTVKIPYVWVTAPINAGFFLYSPPANRRRGGSGPVSLVVSENDKLVADLRISPLSDNEPVVDHRDRWGQDFQLPAEAEWSKRRLLFSFNNTDGSLVELITMPSRRSPNRICVASELETGCEPRHLTGPPLQLRLAGSGRTALPLLTGRAAATVTRIELRFQDGTHATIRPNAGFVLTKIPPTQTGPGHRLTAATAYNSHDRTVDTSRFDPNQPGIYPCKTPRNYGYGITRCP